MRSLITILSLIAVVVPAIWAISRFVVSPAARAVFRRNVTAYFSSLLGYLFIVVFVVAASLLAFNQQFFANNLATLDQLSAMFPVLLLFLVPAITMTVWADERKLGTEELLFTLPARDGDILLGKYTAVLAVYTVALLFAVMNAFVLESMGSPDWGPILSTFVGYWFVGGALLAAGMLASSLTSSVTVAFVLGAVLCAVPVFVNRLPRTLFGWNLPREELAQFGVGDQLREFTLGIVPLTGVLYFVSLATLMLYLNYIVIRRRHWAGDEQTRMGTQYAIRAVCVAVTLVALNAFALVAPASADWTAQDVYSLSPTTKKMLSELDPKRPVQIQAFLSPEVPREFLDVRKRLVGLLTQYDEEGGSKIDVRLVDVEPFSEEAAEARAMGIEPFPVLTERDGKRTREEIFLGLVISSSFDEVVIPSLGPGSLIEYELTRSLGTVGRADRRTVGVLQTDAGLIGNQRDWRIVEELRLQYEIESVNPDNPIDATKYDVLLAVMPSSLTDPQMENFIGYVESGRPVLVFDDPYPMTLNAGSRITIAPRMPKPTPGGMFNQFQQQQPEPKADDGKLTALTRLLNIFWTPEAVLWDEYNPHTEFGTLVPQEYLFIANRPDNPQAISSKSPITAGLEEILCAYAGEVQQRADTPFDFTPLLVTGTNGGVITWDQLTEEMPFDPLSMSFSATVLRQDIPHRLDPMPHAIAAHIRGKEKGQPNVVFVADIDLISDWFFEQRLQNSTLIFDNVTFVLNAVDVLAGDEAFLDLRRRRAKPGTLTAIEQQTGRFKKQLYEEEKALDEEIQKRLDAARDRFAQRREQIEQDPKLNERARAEQLRIAAANEELRLTVEQQNLERQTNKKKEELKNETARQVRRTETNWWLRAVLFPPLPAIILGLSVLLYRVISERSDADPERTVN